MNAQAELNRTLEQVLETGQLANQVMRDASVELDKRKARIDELEFLAHRLLLLIEDVESDSEGRYPHPNTGCLECTLGTVPNDKNTGLCAYHEARRVLGIRT